MTSSVQLETCRGREAAPLQESRLSPLESFGVTEPRAQEAQPPTVRTAGGLDLGTPESQAPGGGAVTRASPTLGVRHFPSDSRGRPRGQPQSCPLQLRGRPGADPPTREGPQGAGSQACPGAGDAGGREGRHAGQGGVGADSQNTKIIRRNTNSSGSFFQAHGNVN